MSKRHWNKRENEVRQELKKEVLEVIEELNNQFRKDNTPQRLSGDEFNDVWEEELKKEISKL